MANKYKISKLTGPFGSMENGNSKMIQLQKLLVKDKEIMTLFIREYDSCEDY